MVAPAEEKSRTPMEIEELLREKLLQMSLKSAVKALADDYNLNKNDVYELALKIKNEK